MMHHDQYVVNKWTLSDRGSVNWTVEQSEHFSFILPFVDDNEISPIWDRGDMSPNIYEGGTSTVMFPPPNILEVICRLGCPLE